MEDGRKNNGGNKNAGRKKKTDEEKAITRLKEALKLTYQNDDDEDNIHSFLVEFLISKEGKKFFAEHLIGKPTEKVQADVTTHETPIIQIIRPSEEE